MMKDNCWRLSFEEFNWKYALTYKEKKENEINDSFIDLFRFRNHTKLYKMARRMKMIVWYNVDTSPKIDYVE